MALREIRGRLQQVADRETAKALRWFFKTGPGEYGEGDVFIGIKVPPLRKLAVEFQDQPVTVVKALLRSKIHEERTLALMILVRQFAAADEIRRERIYNLYLAQTAHINNWDLIDGSAPSIVGQFLWQRERGRLSILARSKSVWERRIAIIATLYFIRRMDYADALEISRLLLADDHHLIHKAVGWMLREVGKRDWAVAEAFLKTHYHEIPRTTLRYAIEHLPEFRRRNFLLGKIS